MVCVKIVFNVVKNLYICSNNLKVLVYLVRALVKGYVHKSETVFQLYRRVSPDSSTPCFV